MCHKGIEQMKKHADLFIIIKNHCYEKIIKDYLDQSFIRNFEPDVGAFQNMFLFELECLRNKKLTKQEELHFIKVFLNFLKKLIFVLGRRRGTSVAVNFTSSWPRPLPSLGARCTATRGREPIKRDIPNTYTIHVWTREMRGCWV